MGPGATEGDVDEVGEGEEDDEELVGFGVNERVGSIDCDVVVVG